MKAFKKTVTLSIRAPHVYATRIASLSNFENISVKFQSNR